jgi:hypothetical protein
MSPFDVEIKLMEAINRERYSSILRGIFGDPNVDGYEIQGAIALQHCAKDRQ